MTGKIKVGNIAFLSRRSNAEIKALQEEKARQVRVLRTSSGEFCELLGIHHDTFNKMFRFFIPEGKKEFDWSLENCRARVEEKKPDLFIPRKKVSRLSIVYQSSVDAFETFLENIFYDKTVDCWYFRSQEARDFVESYTSTLGN